MFKTEYFFVSQLLTYKAIWGLRLVFDGTTVPYYGLHVLLGISLELGLPELVLTSKCGRRNVEWCPRLALKGPCSVNLWPLGMLFQQSCRQKAVWRRFEEP